MTGPLRHLSGLFVTGTDTGVGKTTVAATLVRHWQISGRRVGAYKPAASGSVIRATGEPVWEDVEAYFKALDGTFPRDRICPQCFTAPLAPPVAARHEGREVDDDLLGAGVDWWRPQVDSLIVEGAGGLLSPLSGSQSNADVAAKLGFPLLIVGRLGLGTINHTLLTVAVARQLGLPICGIVLNATSPDTDDPSIKSNPQELALRCTVPILGVLPYSPKADLLHHPAFLRMLELLEQNAALGGASQL